MLKQNKKVKTIKLPQRKTPGWEDFTGEYCQLYEKEIIHKKNTRE